MLSMARWTWQVASTLNGERGHREFLLGYDSQLGLGFDPVSQSESLHSLYVEY